MKPDGLCRRLFRKGSPTVYDSLMQTQPVDILRAFGRSTSRCSGPTQSNVLDPGTKKQKPMAVMLYEAVNWPPGKYPYWFLASKSNKPDDPPFPIPWAANPGYVFIPFPSEQSKTRWIKNHLHQNPPNYGSALRIQSDQLQMRPLRPFSFRALLHTRKPATITRILGTSSPAPLS